MDEAPQTRTQEPKRKIAGGEIERAEEPAAEDFCE